MVPGSPKRRALTMHVRITREKTRLYEGKREHEYLYMPISEKTHPPPLKNETASPPSYRGGKGEFSTEGMDSKATRSKSTSGRKNFTFKGGRSSLPDQEKKHWGKKERAASDPLHPVSIRRRSAPDRKERDCGGNKGGKPFILHARWKHWGAKFPFRKSRGQWEKEDALVWEKGRGASGRGKKGWYSSQTVRGFPSHRRRRVRKRIGARSHSNEERERRGKVSPLCRPWDRRKKKSKPD